MNTCPHCGRDLEGTEVTNGHCNSDDCPRLDEIKQALEVLSKYIKDAAPKQAPEAVTAPMWDFFLRLESWIYEVDDLEYHL